MKRVFLCGVAMAALAGSAGAADIPRRVEATKAPVAYVAPIYNWTGAYIGINGGWAGGDAGMGAVGFDVDGGLVGATLGYNWQAGQAVFGLEGDINWTNIEGSGTCGALTCRVSNNWLGTVRGRLGYAIDRFMPYVTGGLAFGDVEASATGLSGSSNTQTGWTVGGGVEFALAPARWTAKLEYLYVDLGEFTCGAAACGAAAAGDVTFNSHIVRAGLNYRF